MNKAKTTITTLLFVFAAAIANAAPISKDEQTNIAVDGYDLIGFFAESSAIKGNPQIRTIHNDTVYFFASEANKSKFENNPEKYLPAYGGYCAFGASIGTLLPVDIDTWEIVDGKLVFQYNHEIRELFNKDSKNNFAKADAYWGTL